MLTIPLIGTLYAMQDHARSSMHILATEVDRITPFIPVFSLFYMVWYPFLFVTLVLLFRKRRVAYYRTLAAVCLGILTANMAFLLFPTYVPRPPLGTGWNFLVPLTYRLDEPYNGFPSIHVLTCYLMLRGSEVLPRWTRRVVIAMAVLIIMSTLFIKQHVLADAAGGIAVGEAVFRIAGRLFKPKPLAMPHGDPAATESV